MSRINIVVNDPSNLEFTWYKSHKLNGKPSRAKDGFVRGAVWYRSSVEIKGRDSDGNLKTWNLDKRSLIAFIRNKQKTNNQAVTLKKGCIASNGSKVRDAFIALYPNAARQRKQEMTNNEKKFVNYLFGQNADKLPIGKHADLNGGLRKTMTSPIFKGWWGADGQPFFALKFNFTPTGSDISHEGLLVLRKEKRAGNDCLCAYSIMPNKKGLVPWIEGDQPVLINGIINKVSQGMDVTALRDMIQSGNALPVPNGTCQIVK